MCDARPARANKPEVIAADNAVIPLGICCSISPVPHFERQAVATGRLTHLIGKMKKFLVILGLLINSCSPWGSGLDSLALEGHKFHASLETRQIDDSDQHMPHALLSENPRVSTNPEFVSVVVRNASRSSLGTEGIRSALYAVYREKNDLGFCGLETVSTADADRWEKAVLEIWAHNLRLGLAKVHRKGLVIVLVWTHGVSPECWEAVNAKVVERLAIR